MAGRVAEDDPKSIGRVELVGGAGRLTMEVEPKMAKVKEGNIEG